MVNYFYHFILLVSISDVIVTSVTNSLYMNRR